MGSCERIAPMGGRMEAESAPGRGIRVVLLAEVHQPNVDVMRQKSCDTGMDRTLSDEFIRACGA